MKTRMLLLALPSLRALLAFAQQLAPEIVADGQP
jgi:hypothetical protein